MLAAAMYHHAGVGRFGNPPWILERQLRYLRKRAIGTVLPGEPCRTGDHICLVFDDAYCDFFHSVYPLLRRHGMCAVLSIPTGYILEETDQPPDVRMAMLTDEITESSEPKPSAVFCTWREVCEMCASGVVVPAAHGHAHRIAESCDELLEEAIRSRDEIEGRTGVRPLAFTPPHGKTPPGGIARLAAHFPYIFSIGGEKYIDWPPAGVPVSRYPGDNQRDYRSLVDALYPRRSLRFRLGRARQWLASRARSNPGTVWESD